jgi:hypothetical protein
LHSDKKYPDQAGNAVDRRNNHRQSSTIRDAKRLDSNTPSGKIDFAHLTTWFRDRLWLAGAAQSNIELHLTSGDRVPGVFDHGYLRGQAISSDAKS